MLEEEEVEMEVKSSPRLLTSCNVKASQLEKAKDNCRNTGGGSPRYNKRRDPAQQKVDATNASRRPQPQKFKSLDKRPRSRNTTWNGRRDEVTHAQRAEYGSALPNGPKKVNLNHLINFTFTPRDPYGDGPGNGSALHGRSKWNRRRPRYNKEQFLQANCQFVVRADHDYTVHAGDADILVEWDLIEQVRIFSHEETCCPICLYPPTAAKMTRCGHVYCWSCILHYLSLGERSWRKCPICYEAIIEKDLKSVFAVSTHNHCVGEQVTMRLMKREKGSVVPVPVSHEFHKQNNPFMLGDEVTKECFVKLLTTTNMQIMSEIIGPEKEILQVQLATCDDDFERTFIEAAIKLNQEREDALLSQTVSVDVVKDVEIADEIEDDVKHFDFSSSTKDCFTYTSAYSDEEEVKGKASPDLESPLPTTHNITAGTKQVIAENQGPSNASADLTSPTAHTITAEMEQVNAEKGSPKTHDSDVMVRGGKVEDGIKEEKFSQRRRRQSSETEHIYYFYQAADSQHLYIHSLNARCLISEYGSLSKCPETITGQVIEIEHLTMTEELRKRYRYLKHLPLTCEFCVCELKLKPPIISKETIKAFSDDFHKKKRARDKKVREEKKRSQKIELEEGRKQGKYPSPRMSMQSHAHFPDFSPSIQDDTHTLPSSPTSSIGSSSATHDETTLFDAVLSTNHSGNTDAIVVESAPSVSVSAPSFAQMLRTASAKPQEAWPNLSSHTTKAPILAATPVWGKTPVCPYGSDEENEDYVPVPTYKDSFSNAIQVALDKAALKEHADIDEPSKSPNSPGGKKGKKGKKKQKQLLFSTAGQRFK